MQQRRDRDPADGVDPSDGDAANRDRAEREAADRHPEPDRGAADRRGQADRRAADREQPARDAADREHADRDVPDRDDPARDPRLHRRRVEPAGDVEERPAGDAARRLVLEAVAVAEADAVQGTRRHFAPRVNVTGSDSGPWFQVPASSVPFNAPVKVAATAPTSIVTSAAVWRMAIGISTLLPSRSSTVPADEPSGWFVSVSTSRSFLPWNSMVPFQTPSRSLPIAALLGGAAIFASPVRARSNGTV